MAHDIQWKPERKAAAFRPKSGNKYSGDVWKQKLIAGKGSNQDHLKMIRTQMIKLESLLKVFQFSVTVLPHVNAIAVINDVL